MTTTPNFRTDPTALPKHSLYLKDYGTHWGVQMRDGRFALIEHEDLVTLLSKGFTRSWQLAGPTSGKRYVQLSCNHNGVQRGPIASRVLCGAMPCEAVRYKNGDSLDLRRVNLVLRDSMSNAAPCIEHRNPEWTSDPRLLSKPPESQNSNPTTLAFDPCLDGAGRIAAHPLSPHMQARMLA